MIGQVHRENTYIMEKSKILIGFQQYDKYGQRGDCYESCTRYFDSRKKLKLQ